MNPQLLSITNWAAWFPAATSFKNNNIETSTIPINLKRRCSHISKIALEIANRALASNHIDYAVFCSQHGETNCTINLLQDICHKTILSPMNFSQSVHNTVAGLFSIIHNLQQDITTVAARNNTFLMGMLEATTWMRLNPNKTVLFTIFDEHMPKEYKALNVENDYEYAAAFLLTDIPFVNEFSESGKNRPEYFEFRLGGESQATGVYKDIHEDCERRSQQRLNSKDEGYKLPKSPFISFSCEQRTNSNFKQKQPAALEFLEWFLCETATKLTQHTDHQTIKWQKN